MCRWRVTWRASPAFPRWPQRKDVLIVDKSIHASLWDGVRLSGADVERFTHEDMRSLEALLAQLDPDQPKIIVVDGVYSMEGHVASLPEIVALADEHRAFLVVDDCHGFGVLGPRGSRGGGPLRPDGESRSDLRKFFQIACQHGWIHRG